MNPTPQYNAFLDRVRTTAPSGIWSLGVKWSRAGVVTLELTSPNEVHARVRERGRAIPATVILYVEDEEWDCDCGAKGAICAHVTAAAISLATPKGESSAGPPIAVTLRYILSVDHGSICLQRSFVGGTDERMSRPLADMIAARELPPGFDAEHDDLAIDRIMQRRVSGDLPIGELTRIFEALASREVRLDDQPIKVNGENIRPTATVVERADGGTVVELTPGRGVRVVAMGVGLLDGALRPLAETRELGLRWERLPERRGFDKTARGDLLTRVLPELERRYLVLHGEHLRDTEIRKAEVRVAFQIVHRTRGMDVIPTIVYGDPPIARVDPSGALVMTGQIAVVRNESKERELARRLRDEFSLAVGRRASFEGLDAAAMTEKLAQFCDGTGFAGAVAEISPKVSTGPQGPNVWFETQDGRTVDLDAAFEAHSAGLSLVGMVGGGFAQLPKRLLEKHKDIIAALLSAKASQNDVGVRAATLLAKPLFEDISPSILRQNDALRSLFEIDSTADCAGFAVHAELRPYQQEGVRFLVARRRAQLGALLADDMGLGKTIQTIAAIDGLCLVICPRSVLSNWVAELQRFRPELPVVRYEGPGRSLPEGPCVVLTTYAILRLDIELLVNTCFDVAVLDEAQAIKNHESQVAQAAYRLQAKFRIAMTGTPIENRLEDLHSIMAFAVPGLLGSRSRFLEHYSAEAGSDLRRLKRLLAPFVLRRTKDEVLKELPPKTESITFVELDEKERTVYDAVLSANRSEIIEELNQGKTSLRVLELLLRLRQAACHTGLLPGQSRTSSSKVDVLVEALSEIQEAGHRALVFSQWTSLLDRVEPELITRNIRFDRLDGSTRDRGGVVNRFQSQDGPTVLLLSLKAGGAGLNLTAADHVFLLDPWWNPAVERQAEDRAHRIGQDRAVFVHRLVAKDTIEEGIVALVAAKRALAEEVMGEGDFALPIGREDLMSLLRS